MQRWKSRKIKELEEGCVEKMKTKQREGGEKWGEKRTIDIKPKKDEN